MDLTKIYHAVKKGANGQLKAAGVESSVTNKYQRFTET